MKILEKKALLLHYIGDEAYDVYLTVSDEQIGKDAVNNDGYPDEYRVLGDSFTTHFTPKENTAYEI